ncbi:MAG: hypothetical protein M1133_10830 [Armatimonadetes bacterium]|nr:hypothetical protein [Armatimonadota bacterium]
MVSIPSILQALWLVVLFNGNPVTLNTQDSQEFTMRLAWNAVGQRIRYVPFAASDPMVAKLLDHFARFSDDYVPVDWSLALKCALDKDVLNDVYLINCGQTVIFTREPCDPDYTPLWRVHYLEFCGIPFPPTINTLDQVEDALASGDLVQIRPDSVLDATIVQDSNGKLIPQALEFEIAEQEIELPVIAVFFKLPFHPRTCVTHIAFTDTSDAALAERLGANFAPRLANLEPDCCDPVYAIVDPVAPGQLPIINNVQHYRNIDCIQSNLEYTPLRCWSLFSRTAPPCGTGTNPVLNSQALVDFLVEKGLVTPVPSEFIVTNSPSVRLTEL